MDVMFRLTREQVRKIDRVAADRYHIPGVVLMENAAIAATNVAMEMVSGRGAKAVMICGGGNNGGDGLAVARHLHNRGCDVEILLAANPEKYIGEAKTNWEICQAMQLPTAKADPTRISNSRAELFIDAIFGTGLSSPPRPPFAELVQAIQRTGTPILAIDIPSGLDCDSGRPIGETCIQATRTITFVAEKKGFAEREARQYLGRVTVGDIGCPVELIAEVARDEAER